MTDLTTAEPAAPRAANADTRRIAYAVLIVVASSIIGARILTAPPPFSVNDSSRWATIRALVETGSYSIGQRLEYGGGHHRNVGIMSEPGWHTVDLVMKPNFGRFYSSKPPLLPTVLAGEYWLLRQLFGLEMADDRVAVSRIILLTVNWAPFVLFLICFARMAERLGATDWGRLFAVSAACFGTFVAGFLAVLNNHTVAATAALFAVYQCVTIHVDDDRRWWRFGLAGVFAGWAACNELPAASLAAGVMLWLARLSLPNAVRYALPALLFPVAAYLYVQYSAFGSILPTYARADWYDFPGSYWLNPVGIDRADDPKLLYAFHLVMGHAGVLSLTPVLLLGWIGMARGAGSVWHRAAFTPHRVLSVLTAALTVIVIAFYVFRTNDYGGVTAGPRWLFWLTPLWLLTMLPEADRWAKFRWSRRIAAVLLAISIVSAMYALDDPWRPSWLFALLTERGVISYP